MIKTGINKIDKRIEIRPDRNVLTKLYCHFQDFCIECGGLHLYRKYKGWQKRSHIPLCYKDPGPDFEDGQQDLF
jgi:hypothetical protein